MTTYIPRCIRTGHAAPCLIRQGAAVMAFQPHIDIESLDCLDAPPCLPSGGLLACAGPAVGLALWWGR